MLPYLIKDRTNHSTLVMYDDTSCRRKVIVRYRSYSVLRAWDALANLWAQAVGCGGFSTMQVPSTEDRDIRRARRFFRVPPES